MYIITEEEYTEPTGSIQFSMEIHVIRTSETPKHTVGAGVGGPTVSRHFLAVQPNSVN